MTTKIGCAYDPETKLGPVVSAKHKKSICDWIQKGLDEGAELVLDGRNIVVPGYENGFFVGPTILDHITPEMSIGQREIFGPVTLIKRVKTFEEGLAIMNANPFANGSAIFTQNGYYARQFEMLTDGGMVGINVGIFGCGLYTLYCREWMQFLILLVAEFGCFLLITAGTVIVEAVEWFSGWIAEL